jgi:hypothetical protein
MRTNQTGWYGQKDTGAVERTQANSLSPSRIAQILENTVWNGYIALNGWLEPVTCTRASEHKATRLLCDSLLI